MTSEGKMKRQVARCCTLLMLIGATGSLGRAQFAHPDLKSGKVAIHKVLIMPPEASITKSGMKGNDTLTAESRMVEGALPGILAAAFRTKGCTVLDDIFATDALDKNPDLKYAVADIQTHYDDLRKHLDGKPKDVTKGRFTMGDEVLNFNPGASADALVFVRAGGVVNTGGKKVFGALVAGTPEVDFILVNIAVVDSQSGAVLYYGRSVTTGGYLEHTDRMTKPIEGSLKDWKVGKK